MKNSVDSNNKPANLEEALVVIDNLKRLNELANEKIQYLLKIIYGKKAEQKSQLTQGEWVQVSLFDEVEANDAVQKVEEEEETLKVVKVKKKTNNLDISKLGLQEKIVEHRVKISKDIKTCEVGWKETKKLVWVPAHGYVRVDRYQTVKYTDENGNIVFKSAERTDSEMFRGSIIAPEFVASVIHDKFVMHLPLYRQEAELARKGIPISRMNLCNYITKFAAWAKPVHDLISQYIKNADNVRADETTLNVIELNGTKARIEKNGKSKSYIWLFCTAEGYHQAFDYVLGPGRDYKIPFEYFPLLEKKRYLQSDGYEAYSCNMSSKKWVNVTCLVHIRRKFADVIKQDSKLTSVGAQKSSRLVNLIGNIFQKDKEIREEYKEDYEKIKEERIIKLKPMFEEFFVTCEKNINSALPKSKYETALGYAINRKETMMNFFEDGRLALDNNYAEREGIKDLVIGRKNWLFANTRSGANVTCEMFSIIQTAIANNLDPYKYILWLANNLPQPETQKYDWSKFLPWSKEIPEEIKIKRESEENS